VLFRSEIPQTSIFATPVTDLPEVEASSIETITTPTTPFKRLKNVFYDLFNGNQQMIIQQLPESIEDLPRLTLYLMRSETNVLYSYNNSKYSQFASGGRGEL
jgi:hypothetical protein